ncbi:MAG TPA: hypothetical protein VNP73_11765, partial [Actinomycetota bacterium]|nr:hypothetical protein [Actinomycetota bacterium]
MRKAPLLCLSVVMLAFGLPFVAPAAAQSPADPAGRETEPVILTGTNFPEWATVGDVTLEQPHTEGAQCLAAQNGSPDEITPEETCSHNTFEDPDFSSGDYRTDTGVAIDKLLGYQWNGESFDQIPFQVDEMFSRYMSNNNSGFAFYSETDQHTTYAFDYDRYTWTASDPDNPCLSHPASKDDPLTPDAERHAAKDPIEGLDTDDEVVFMADDAAAQAPADAELPPGITDSYEVALTDPSAQGATRYAYVMLAGGEKPATAAFTADNGYVRYERDADADVFLFSESSYDNYGAAPEGPWFDPATGTCHTAENEWRQRRPVDRAWIYTPRYKFRYSGRWVMNELHVSDRDKDGETQTFSDLGDLPDDWYGPDLIDQWKARAFQQRPSGQTPCCGYEEEVNNWGGSSMLMGERVGPVRAIRESWGADSSTNLARREIFYRDEIRFSSFLRVHVIPPLDGIYAQWDYNLGTVEKYYNPIVSEGVDIDGQNDEAFGNSRLHIGRDGVSYDGDDTASDQIDEATGSDTQSVGNPNEPDCSYPGDPAEAEWDDFRRQIPDPIGGELPGDVVDLCIYNDIDSPDPAFSGVNAGLNWEEIAGENGTLVLR